MKNKDIGQLAKYWSGKQFLGLSVFDTKENNCGKIQSLCIDPKTFSISGAMVKKRFSSAYFLSVTYFDSVTDSMLCLNSIPIKPNDKVANIDGKPVGKVVRINLHPETNRIESLEIKSRFKSKTVLSDRIVGVGSKVTVNV